MPSAQSGSGVRRACATALLSALIVARVFAQSSCDVHYLESPQPDARASYALAFDSSRDRVLLFGGANPANGRGTYADLWAWHDGIWSAVWQGAVRPPARSQAGMAFDRDRQRLVLFGGLSPSNITLSDVWEWDGQSWTLITPSPAPARRRFAIAYDELRRNVVVFGGTTGGNETRTWNGSQWTLAATGPMTPRQGAAMAFDAQRGVVVLFGGLFGTAGYLNETWTWDGSAWSARLTGPNTPPGRHSHAMAYDRARQRVVLFGGTGVGGVPLMDTWLFNGTDWTAAPPQEFPSARTLVSAAYDEDSQRSMVFGGFSNTPSDTYFSGTWLWDGSRWSPGGSRTVPSSRVYPAIAYDRARGVTVVVGGRGAAGLLNDTWQWNGLEWSFEPTLPGERPGIVERAAMCFDSRRNVAVHFGGQNDTLLSGETWEWNGTHWSLAAQVGPSPRRAHAMAFDPLRGESVLFGGEHATGRSDETWVWNGAVWALKHPDHRPAPRVHPAMAFDEVRGQVILSGGFADGIGYTNDSWAWDGYDWHQLTLQGTQPAPRDEHGLVFDSARGRLILVGGLIADNQPTNDAWELVGDSWSPITDLPPTPRFGAGFVFDVLRARAMMVGGADTSSLLDQVWLLRSESPEILRSPTSKRLLIGASVELRVAARSDSALSYTWRRNGEPLSDSGTISGSRSSILRISPASIADTASYDVLVSNACGSTPSLSAAVTVRCPADLDDGTATGTPDGGVTIEDLLYYLVLYDQGVAAADLDDGSGTGTPDGGVTIEDLLYFLQRYEGGC